MMRRAHLFFVAIVGACAALAGCSGPDACAQDSDCPSGRYCDPASAQCRFDCSFDAECPAGSLCNPRGHCLPGCQNSETCPPGTWCEAEQCVECQVADHCGPDCYACSQLAHNRACVSDHCGCLSEADCAPDEACTDTICQAGCQADCAGKQCGDNGCGDSCGDCDPLADCDANGQCQCRFQTCAGVCCQAEQVCASQACCSPDCGGRECGLDPVCGAPICGDCDQWACNFETSLCMRNQVVPMTGPDTPCGIVTSSIPSTSNTAGWKAFDGTPAAFITGGSDMPPYTLSYEFTEAPIERRVLAYAIQFETAHGWLDMAPRNWTLEAFDGAGWVVIDTRTNQVGWSEGEVRQFSIPTPGSYSTYLLRVSVTNGMPDVAIGELSLLY